MFVRIISSFLLSTVVSTSPEKVTINDNRAPAGKLANGVLTLRLEARAGVWYPDGERGLVRAVAAFGEVGKQLQVPGPLVRVPLGTRVEITLRNTLNDTLRVFGLGEKRGFAADTTVLAPGATHSFRFKADQVGAFWYAARKMPKEGGAFDVGAATSQLNGAIVVDAPNAAIKDRVFLISWLFGQDSTSVSGLTANSVIAVNGLAYPHSENLKATQGEEQHWKFINTTSSPHPMHLHGFYFRVDADGDGKSYTEHAPQNREMAVTHILRGGRTFALTWVPQKPGNWIIHCHIAGHMTSIEGLNKDRRFTEPVLAQHTKSSHDNHYMANLVLGITVKPKGSQKASTAAERPLRLVIKSKAKVFGEYAGYSYVLGGTPAEHDANAMPLNGPTLVLKKDEPVAVTIVNRSHEGAAVHWHGIELESFPDGVPGVSGYQKNLLPTIAPRDSLTVRFTPPRAGTFMYHSHFNENQQIGSGLVGAIVVVDDPKQFDPSTDRVLLFSDGGPIVHIFNGPFQPVTLNGALQPDALEMKAGTTYRLRLISIRSEFPVHATLLDGDEPVMWKRLARDGADLPEHQRREVPAAFNAEPGMIADFAYTPQKAGALTLKFGYPQGFDSPPFPALKSVTVNVR